VNDGKELPDTSKVPGSFLFLLDFSRIFLINPVVHNLCKKSVAVIPKLPTRGYKPWASRSAARFDKLSDRAADEEFISPTGDSSRLSQAGDKLRMIRHFRNLAEAFS